MKWQNIVLTFIGLFFVFIMVYFKEFTLFFFLSFLDNIGIKEWNQLTIPVTIIVTLITILLLSIIFKKKEN